MILTWSLCLFLNILFPFRERGREGEREREKHPCVRGITIGCLLHTRAGVLARNPGMCPDWECRLVPNPLSHTSQGQSLLVRLFIYLFILKFLLTLLR